MIKKVQDNLNNNLKKCRFEKDGISQQELANAIGVTRLTIHSIETGKFNPSVLLALKISRFFEKPVEEIFFLEKDNRQSGKKELKE
jgi:putative transcriptional regulator